MNEQTDPDLQRIASRRSSVVQDELHLTPEQREAWERGWLAGQSGEVIYRIPGWYYRDYIKQRAYALPNTSVKQVAIFGSEVFMEGVCFALGASDYTIRRLRDELQEAQDLIRQLGQHP